MDLKIFALFFIGFIYKTICINNCTVKKNKLSICTASDPIKTGMFIYYFDNRHIVDPVNDVCCLALTRKIGPESGTFTLIGTCKKYGTINKNFVVFDWENSDGEYPEIRCRFVKRKTAGPMLLYWNVKPFTSKNIDNMINTTIKTL